MLYAAYTPPFWVREVGALVFLHDVSWIWLTDAEGCRNYGEIPWEWEKAIDPITRFGEKVYYGDGIYHVLRTGRSLLNNLYLLGLPNNADASAGEYDAADWYLVTALESEIRPAPPN